MTGNTYQPTSKEGWAKISGWIIYEVACPSCFRIYCYLDLRQGKDGNPVRGARYVARELKMKTDTVLKHLDHLSDAGLVRLSRKTDNGSTTIELIHNPARNRSSPSAVPVEPSRGRARLRPTSPPPQRFPPPEPVGINENVPYSGTVSSEPCSPSLSPNGGHSVSQMEDNPVPRCGTPPCPDEGRDPVAEQETGSRSACRSEGRSTSSSSGSLPSVPVSPDDAIRLIFKHLIETLDAPEAVATEIATNLVNGRPFYDDGSVDPGQIQHWKAMARGQLRAVRLLRGGR